MRIGRFKAFRVNHRARTMAESMELGEITLEKFRLWTPEALKYYLSIRKRSGTGSFDDLVARLVKNNFLWTCHCVTVSDKVHLFNTVLPPH